MAKIVYKLSNAHLQVYGEDVAILAGDALLTLAFEYICRETRGLAPERIVRVSILVSEPLTWLL